METLTCMPLSYEKQQDLNNLPVIWVKNQEQLFDLLDEIDECQVIALDTEFIKRDSFFPILALIQINTGRAIYLLDAPKLYLEELWEVIRDVPTVVLHACGEDLGIYYLLSNLPAMTNVFDTQIGVSFLCNESSLGYQKTLQALLNVQIDKGESQSDWLQRPLTYEQELYAVDDVKYLLTLFDVIQQQLQTKNLWKMACEDCQSYSQELYDNFHTPYNQLYLTVADFRDNRQQLAILQTLCEWRETLAKSINRPRTYILRPQALREIIEKPPLTLKQLGFTSTKPHVIRMYGQEILNLINEVRKADENSYPPLLPLPYRSLSDDIQEQLQQVINIESERLGVSDNVVLRKKWLTDIYAYSLDTTKNLPNWLTGWRHQWVIKEILPILQKVHQNSNDEKTN